MILHLDPLPHHQEQVLGPNLLHQRQQQARNNNCHSHLLLRDGSLYLHANFTKRNAKPSKMLPDDLWKVSIKLHNLSGA